MSPVEMGEHIRRRRKLLQLTQQDVAELVGVNRRLVSEVERGSERVTLHHLLAICEVVGLDLSLQPRYADRRST